MNLAFTLALPHGTCVGVAIPAALTPELRAGLHPDERRHADALGPGRQPPFAAGRVALRAAIAAAGLATGDRPCLPRADGAPDLPAGVLASISHKRHLAIALAAPAPADPLAGLGVDLEDDRPPRIDIGRRVLTDGERARLDGLPPAERDRRLIQHFSLKEAFYKAVNGFGLAAVSFRNVEVAQITAQGMAEFVAPLPLEQQLRIAGWIGSPVPGYVVASVRCDGRRSGEQPT
jgi:4'-phosphopantetheinyl transferase EntD